VWHRLIGSHQVNKTRVEAVGIESLLREDVNEASEFGLCFLDMEEMYQYVKSLVRGEDQIQRMTYKKVLR
jgi:hypothetical protein